MLSIGGVLVSSEVIETYFACDLEACKGVCCIEGDAGAPVTSEEALLIEQAYPIIKPLLPKLNLRLIKKKGFTYRDMDNELVTSIAESKDGRCLFTCFEEDGSCRCGFEKSYTERLGNDLFYKPLSCHLYPIRVQVLRDGTHALNYDRWYPICEPARKRGRKEGIRMYQFLKSALIRAYGEEWYHELEEVAEAYLQQTEQQGVSNE
ncbi:MAG: DUF3109 family protein [Porphyromonas sp.]|nr:DUF3109 family protein [Porphyromonas sp.]